MIAAAPLDQVAWSALRLGEAIEAFARYHGAPPAALVARGAWAVPSTAFTPGDCVEHLANHHGLEAEAVVVPYPALDRFLGAGGPALLGIDDDTRFVLVVRRARRGLVVLGPDDRLRTIPTDAVQARMGQALEASMVPRLDAMLDEVGIPARKRQRARASLLRQWLQAGAIQSCWLLRPRPGVSLWRSVRERGLHRHILQAGAAHAIGYGLGLLAVSLIGRGFLLGRLDPGWLYASGLLLLLSILLGLFANFTAGQLAIGFGVLLKQRLLYGTLALDPAEIRHQGAGQLLGRVIESDAVETLTLGGGGALVFALIELCFAGAVLFMRPAGRLAGLLLILWLACAASLFLRYLRRRRTWTRLRLGMTHDLVERIVGHRTCLVQEPPSRRHEAEEAALSPYLDASRDLDRSQTALAALVPRGWLVLGLLVVAPFIIGGRADLEGAALCIAGVVIAYRALRSLGAGLVATSGALIAWQEIAPLHEAAARAARGEDTAARLCVDRLEQREQALVEVEHLSIIHPHRTSAILRDCALRIFPGDRILLEGDSGSGKSTLASILCGLRPPQHGTLWLGGLDRQTLGLKEWRRHVVLVPQFQENYILSGTLAFNLLLGRRWPPEPADLEQAAEVCEALGLGDLLRRMPSGLDQIVGETGWQLSHGEKSRIYMARALLQEAELVILDESFGALDPETLQRSLGCAFERASTLMVIAHP
ncbi:MAG TPA: ATP-binding cassette domain-containing protein [Polyangia bacterium]|jgi:ATP-binding cassette subfamily B protein|nr:ATP-binding cassette domain-containing protein [Polyangia bacterium]